jgi:hypothetical protein
VDITIDFSSYIGAGLGGSDISSLEIYIVQEPTLFTLAQQITNQTTNETTDLPLGAFIGYPFTIVYHPTNFSYGQDYFSYEVYDPQTKLFSAIAGVNISVARGFHNPVWVAPDTSNVTEDTPAIIKLGGYDPDGDAIECRWTDGNYGTWYECILSYFTL